MSFLICILFVLLVGCTSEKEKEIEGASLKINDKIFSYDKKLIEAIDKTQWIDTSNPPTVKCMKPEREPQFNIEVLNNKNEKYTLWDTGEYFLIAIDKEKKNYWLTLDGEEYLKAKKQTAKYKEVEIDYPLSIDAVANKIQKKHPHSDIYIYEVESEFQIPGYNQERQCFSNEKECINYYLGEKLDDTLVLKEKLEDKLALMNMIVVPKIYSVRNVVIMYTPHKTDDYVLEEDILEAIKSLE